MIDKIGGLKEEKKNMRALNIFLGGRIRKGLCPP